MSHERPKRRSEKQRPGAGSERPATSEGPAVVSRRWLLLKAGDGAERAGGAGAGRPRGAVSAGAGSQGFVLQVVGFPRRHGQISRSARRGSCPLRIPGRSRGMDKRTTSLLTCGARARASSRSSRLTARILGARCGGFRNRSFSCARATVAFTTPMDRGLLGPRSAGFSPTTTK